ncbi:MAG TPA: hypothetical protein DCP37_08610 [Dehalococcoidia bacterium]|nr:hypothetical protein [Dehalococcoidia bacterium]
MHRAYIPPDLCETQRIPIAVLDGAWMQQIVMFCFTIFRGESVRRDAAHLVVTIVRSSTRY